MYDRLVCDNIFHAFDFSVVVSCFLQYNRGFYYIFSLINSLSKKVYQISPHLYLYIRGSIGVGMDFDSWMEWSKEKMRKIEQLRQKVKEDKAIILSEEFQELKKALGSH